MIVAISAPALGQDLPTVTVEQLATAVADIESLNLDDDTYRDLWCGGAFILYNTVLTQQNKPDEAAAAMQNGILLLNRVEANLPAGLTPERLNEIGANGTMIALAQINSPDEGFKKEDCEAAAKE